MTLSTDGTLRVQFAHGLEGSPQGDKARLLKNQFTASVPAMNTRDFETCVAMHTLEIKCFHPDVLVGSSFGAGVVVELMRRGNWRGATLLLAQAALRMFPEARLPSNVPVWLLHGSQDKIIDPEDSYRLAETGTGGCVRVFELDDDHALHRSVNDGTIVRLIRELAATARTLTRT